MTGTTLVLGMWMGRGGNKSLRAHRCAALVRVAFKPVKIKQCRRAGSASCLQQRQLVHCMHTHAHAFYSSLLPQALDLGFNPLDELNFQNTETQPLALQHLCISPAVAALHASKLATLTALPNRECLRGVPTRGLVGFAGIWPRRVSARLQASLVAVWAQSNLSRITRPFSVYDEAKRLACDALFCQASPIPFIAPASLLQSTCAAPSPILT